MTVLILIGDVRARMTSIPDDSVDVVVSSPPYWGLRDYGTATWVGGDPECDHLAPMPGGFASSGLQAWGTQSAEGVAVKVTKRQQQFRSSCKKCGADRVDAQIGLEPTLGEHLDVMVALCREVRRVLKPGGSFWLNYGDCYATSPNGRSAADTKSAGGDDRTFRDKPFSTVGAIYEPQPEGRTSGRRGVAGNLGNGGFNGSAIPDGRVVARGGTLKPKDLCMIPNRLAIALQDDGWWVRSENVWGKTNPMPESVSDRSATAHEKVFHLTKAPRYAYDPVAVRQGRTSDENANGFRGGSYVGGEPGPRDAVGNYRVLTGWDTTTGEGGHGSVHREGRRVSTPGRQRGDSFARQHKASAGEHGQSPQFRTDREAVAYLRGNGRNLRNYEPAPLTVWPMATTPFDSELCEACGRYFDRKAVRALRVETIQTDKGDTRRRYCLCGSHTDWLSHFATFPPSLVERCLDASDLGEGAMVLDPFGGAGTTALVAAKRGLDCTLIELNPAYATLAMHRIAHALPEADIVMGGG